MHKLDKRTTTICEAVGVFQSEEDLQSAIDELQSTGFDYSALSVLGDGETEEEDMKLKQRKISDLEEDPDVPRKTYLPRETLGNIEGVLIGLPVYICVVTVAIAIIASGGSIMTAVAASLISGGFGVAIGLYLAMRAHKNHEDNIKEQLDRGGLLLWVDTANAEQEKNAIRILKKHSAEDVHLFNMPVSH